MQDVKVIGVESDSLLLLANNGERFRLPLSALARSGVRTTPKDPLPAGARTVSPKQIQAQIRSGLSAEQVAASTGSELEYVRRFEGPVMAEREHIVQSARAVPVHSPLDSDSLDGHSVFGAVIQRRLDALGASEIRWDSWKDGELSWTIQLTFTAHTIDHDARWEFEPRKRTLQPHNSEATALSQQTDAAFTGEALLPKLRAVAPEPQPDTSRFDSGAFTTTPPESPETGRRHAGLVALPSATSPAEDSPAANGSTAELLESLRRRRGERQGMPSLDDGQLQDSSISIVDIPLHSVSPPPAGADADQPDGAGHADAALREEAHGRFAAADTNTRPLPQVAPQPAQGPAGARPEQEVPGAAASAVATGAEAAKAPQGKRQQTGSHGRRGRASMPSWDEIVFGTRPEND